MKYYSTPLKPPCSNKSASSIAVNDIQDAGRPLYILVRSLDHRNISDYFVNINKTVLEEDAVYYYFRELAMDAEEDEDLLEVLPNEKLYMLEMPATISQAAFIQLAKSLTGQTHHFTCSNRAARIICMYGQLLKVYNFLDYCDVPEL